jgi:hypothetical protein
MPVEASDQRVFDFGYGEDFGAHIEDDDPDFSKVLGLQSSQWISASAIPDSPATA